MFLYEENLISSSGKVAVNEINGGNDQDKENRLDKGSLNNSPKDDNLTQAILDILLEGILNTDVQDEENRLDKGSLNSFPKEDSIIQDISGINLKDIINTDVPDKGNCLDKGSLNSFPKEDNYLQTNSGINLEDVINTDVPDKGNFLDKGPLNSFPKEDSIMQDISGISLEDIINTDVPDKGNCLDKGSLNSFPKEDSIIQDISDFNFEDIINTGIPDKGNCLDKGSLNSFPKEDSIIQDISGINLKDIINTDVPDKGNCLDKGSLNSFPKEDNYLQTNSGISLEDVINTDIPDKGNCLDKGSLNNFPKEDNLTQAVFDIPFKNILNTDVQDKKKCLDKGSLNSFPKEDNIIQAIYSGDNGGCSEQLSSDNKVVNANCQQTVEGLNSIFGICPNNANVENLLSKFPNLLSKNNTRKSNHLDIKNSLLNKKKTSPIQKSHSSKSMNCLKRKYLKENHLYRNMKQKCFNNVINPIQYENGLLDNNYSKLNMNLLTQQLNLFSPSSIVASTSVAGYSPQQSILSVPTSMTSSFPPQFNSSIILSNVYSLPQQHSFSVGSFLPRQHSSIVSSFLPQQPGIFNLQPIINNNKIISIKISDLLKGENKNDKKNYNDNYIDLSKSELNLNIIGNPIIQYNETIDKDSALEILKKVIDFLKNYVDYNKSNNIKVNYELKGIQYTDIEKMIKGEKNKNLKLLNQYNVMKCLGLDINNGLPIHKLLLTGSSKEWQVNTDSQISSYMLKVQCGKMENLSEFQLKKIQKMVLEKINNKIRIKSNNDSWFLHIPIFYVHNRYYFNAPFYVNCEKRYKDYIEHIIKKNLSEKVFILNSIWDHNENKICSNYNYNLELYYKN